MFKTKPVYYRGLIVEVPDWTNYLAVDGATGLLFAFNCKPTYRSWRQIWEVDGGKSELVGLSLWDYTRHLSSRKSLKKV
jgi:hypothetical protein